MRYQEELGSTFRIKDDGTRELMANFTAEIIEETHYRDGADDQTILTIGGEQMQAGERPEMLKTITLPPIRVAASEFSSMTWVLPRWGVRAVIAPGTGIRDDLRTHIQLKSNPTTTDIYRRTGWQVIGRHRYYLHAQGGIGPAGNRSDIKVELPNDLANYSIAHSKTANVQEAIRATLALIDLAPEYVSWPMLAAVIAPTLGACDFALHLAGRTGSFKSEFVSLFQSHYGGGFDARHLPGSWSSTPNALEAQAHYAANAMFTIDDFVPVGTSYQQRQFQVAADKIIRAQGNQAGRARLNDVSSLQKTMYPRGLIVSTGEDIPEGHSVRARMLILELAPDDITPAKLTLAQDRRQVYQETLFAYLAAVAKTPPADLETAINEWRNAHIGIGHTRTPTMAARLIISIQHFLAWAAEQLKLSPEATTALNTRAEQAILDAAGRQHTYLETSDPAEQFAQALQAMLATGGGHVRTLSGGVPYKPSKLGWTEENGSNEMTVYKSRGPLVGWIDWDADELFLDIASGYNMLRKAAGPELALTKQTLLKRLKEAGLLTRTEEARQRNTVRIVADGHTRQVIALSASQALSDLEKPGDAYEPSQKPAIPASK